jgi:diguanylate cyclase (GGDEF)-like protein
MKSTSIKVLLIEDNRGDARLLELMLAQAPAMMFELALVDELSNGIGHLQTERTDVVLLDLNLPGSTGLDSLKRLLAAVPEAPALIVLSGMTDENVAVKAVQSGAQDYLVKGQVDAPLLVRSIRYAMERSQAKQALREANDELERRVAQRTVELANTVAALKVEIAERKQAEEQIRRMVHYDALTGLPNRVLLQDRLHQAINHAHRTHSRVAILFIDLDYFKNINDSLGHHVGDHLLQMAAVRLEMCLREQDNVARLGGDEFVLSLPLLNDSADAARVAQKALDTLAQPFMVEGHQLHVSSSIGISVYPEDGFDVETLMRTADTAMYHAKEMGRNNFQFFTPSLNHAVQQRLIAGTRLRQAMARDELVLHYQPQVDMKSGEIFSAEALLRWRQAGAEPIACGSFIASAEESGLIVPIGEWILRQACAQLKAWRDAGHPDLKMAVNLSPRQLEQPDFSLLIGNILKEAGIPGDALELEITEGTLMRRSEFSLATMAQLSDMGIRLSVDDFGTGYSSLAYLQRFPVHALKIDQSFVQDIGTDPNDSALITAIIAMASSLRLTVIAEGVETPEQARFLLSHECPAAQGFYYSKALPPKLFFKVLDKWNDTAKSACWTPAVSLTGGKPELPRAS